jgi:ribosomal-protein-alanine N-acetyltransferase
VIRRATRADRPALYALQSLLPERAPWLLDHAIDRGEVLVSVAIAPTSAPDGAATAAAEATGSTPDADVPSPEADAPSPAEGASTPDADASTPDADASTSDADASTSDADVSTLDDAPTSGARTPIPGVGAPRQGDRRGVPVGYLLPVRGDPAHVAELAVSPDRRREGRATALLDAFFASLSPGTRVTIAVAPDNEAALSLYREYGFVEYGRREEYFESGPALVLARRATGERAYSESESES